jgi:hypothetical protein
MLPKCFNLGDFKNDCRINSTNKLDLANGAWGYSIGVLTDLEQSTDFRAIIFNHLVQISTSQ